MVSSIYQTACQMCGLSYASLPTPMIDILVWLVDSMTVLWEEGQFEIPSIEQSCAELYKIAMSAIAYCEELDDDGIAEGFLWRYSNEDIHHSNVNLSWEYLSAR